MAKSALILGGGGITGGVYKLGALSALDDFVVRGRTSRDFDIFLGISAGSILAAFLANGITVKEMCKGILGEQDHRLLMRREDIYEIRISPLLRAAWRFLRSAGPIVRYLRRERQPVTFLSALALLELAMEVYGRRHPDVDILLIEPAPMESTLFLCGSMNFSERVQVLNYGYNSAAFFFMENLERLKTCFARHEMDVSLEQIRTDRFLELATRPKTRRRYAMKIYR